MPEWKPSWVSWLLGLSTGALLTFSIMILTRGG